MSSVTSTHFRRLTTHSVLLDLTPDSRRVSTHSMRPSTHVMCSPRHLIQVMSRLPTTVSEARVVPHLVGAVDFNGESGHLRLRTDDSSLNRSSTQLDSLTLGRQLRTTHETLLGSSQPPRPTHEMRPSTQPS